MKNGDRVYLYGTINKNIYTPAVLKEHIDLSIPGVESTVRVGVLREAPVFQVENKEPITSDLIFVDEDFFKLFTYHAIEGDLETALKEPMSVVISKSLSDKLFGNERAIGKTMKLNNNKELTVTAVIEEPKANSSLSISAVTSIATRKVVQPNEGEFINWGWGGFQTFLLLKKGTNPEGTAKSILALFPEGPYRNLYTEAKLTPFKKLYFSGFTLYGSNYLQCGDKKKVMILLMVAALVLMIALVNFINISSSQWLERIKQTGMMKVIGARCSAILRNVLVEAGLFFLMSLFLAIMLISIINPFVQGYTGIHFNPKIFYSPAFILFSIAGTLVLSMVFSLIPALRISSSRAVDNLKKTAGPRKTDFSFRGILVTAQFIIAIVLIAFTVLVQKQVNFGSSNLGFNQDNIIGIKLTQQLNKKKDVLKKILQEKPAVRNILFTGFYPGITIPSWNVEVDFNGEKKQLKFDTFTADAGIFEILGLKLTMGRFYSDDLSTDLRKVVVNETFVREHKLTNPIGGKFNGWDGKSSEIIGVVKDFHFKSVSQPITPLAITNGWYSTYCLVKLQTADFNLMHSAIQDIKSATSQLSPAFPVEISFFDQAVEQMYQSELQFRRTFSLFSACAVVICCLGILAMSLFACQRRVKEIGIRKVNGARVSEVIAMLNKDFVKWVAIAFVIACPIAWYAMHRWLENFAYKTSLSWWIFALTGILALGIALLTVSWQSWKAATRNPVEALRYE
ncbi:MAG: ABC transporter permease [Bacteroidota bacterium]|nr:ABC transporter permease [Bacteroidota bacterium]